MKVSDKYTAEETKYLKTGIYVAIGIIVIVVLFFTVKSKSEYTQDGSYYPLTATFGRTDGLLVGDKVRMAGLDIGRVTSAKFDDKFHAILTLEIKTDVHIPNDSSASIVSYGLMGPKYIEIEAGGSESFLAPNDEFSYTQDAMVLEELINRIVDMGKASRGTKAEKGMAEFNHAMDM